MVHHTIFTDWRARLWSGTAGAVDGRSRSRRGHAGISQDRSLAANGRVSLDNINGNVEITGWNRNEVQIDAVKTASDQQRLDTSALKSMPEAIPWKSRPVSPSTCTNNNPGSVHYTLHVPQDARIDKVNLVNGSLTVQKVTGEIDANLVNGKLQHRTWRARPIWRRSTAPSMPPMTP